MERPVYRGEKKKPKLAKPLVKPIDGEIGTKGRNPISGKFAAGNNFSRGRAPGFRHQMGAAFDSAFTEEDMFLFGCRLKASANRGSHKALRIILDRILGPAHAVFVAGLEMPDVYNPMDRYL